MAKSARPATSASTLTEQGHIAWRVLFHQDFLAEFRAFDLDVRRELVAAARAVERAGPKTGRPHADTLTGSKHDNMKELRFKAHQGRQIWRAAFAFDPERKACILVAGEKQGRHEASFYKALINKADERFDRHLKALASGKKEST